MDILINVFLYSIAIMLAVFCFVVCYSIIYAFYKVYIKKDNPALLRRKNKVSLAGISKREFEALQALFLARDPAVVEFISSLDDEEKAKFVESIKDDPSNWIQLHVEKVGNTMYFYDGDERTGTFLFQCKTYEEMVENLNKIRGHRGVKINAELVKKLEMEDFFIKPEVSKSDESV